MYAIVIGAGVDSVHAINEAKKLGFKVIAFDGNPNAEGLKHADISFVLDINKQELIIQKLSEQHIIPDVVLPIPIGRPLVISGKINDFYHLAGIDHVGADNCTDKYTFHKLLFTKQLRNINCEVVKQSVADINFDLASFNYPLIVKPRYGSGSRGIFTVDNYEELKAKFIDQMPYDEDFIIEEVKEGIEYGVDAAVINGKFHLILLREKIITPYPYRQGTGSYTVIENNETNLLFEKVNQFFSEVMNVMELDNVVLNADIIYDEKDIFLIEITARPAGHYLHDIFIPLATGIDMVSEFIKFAVPKLQQNYSFIPKYKKNLLIKYFDFENCKVLKAPAKDVLFNKYPLLQFQYNDTNSTMEKVTNGHTLMKRGYFIIEGKDKKELDLFSKNILDEFILDVKVYK